MVHLLKHLTCKFIPFNGYKFCSTYSKCLQEVVQFDNGQKMIIKIPVHIASGGQGIAEVGMENTVIFVSAVSKNSHTSQGFFPLSVEYQQKYVPTGYMLSRFEKYKSKTYKEILTSRTIDRAIRPLFQSGLKSEIQLVCKLRSCDGIHDPDVIGINAASTCLAMSSIPWNGPIAAVRVAHFNGKIVSFPTRQELSSSDLNLLVVCGRNKKIVMLEGSGMPVNIDILKKAITTAIEECQPIINSIAKLARNAGIAKNEIKIEGNISSEDMKFMRCLAEERIRKIFTTYSYNKHSRYKKVNEVRNDVFKKLSIHLKLEEYEISNTYNDAFNTIINEVFRNLIFEDGLRIDGRKLDQLRPISCSVNLYDTLHGSSKFQRGQTIVDCSVTIESPEKFEHINPLTCLEDNFTLEYEFPSFATGEIGNSGKLSKREIGHAALAKKALCSLITEMPYSILLSAEVYASNGSSSMATVCGGSMALMDAGINLTSPVSGIAIGLVTKCNEDQDIEDYRLLTDIMGFEDYFGDMDFKMAGTKDGITALQVDIKVSGVNSLIILEAIDKAVAANEIILEIMNKTICQPSPWKSKLPLSKSLDMSPGQKQILMEGNRNIIKNMQIENGVQISWPTDNSLYIFAKNKIAMDKTLSDIGDLLRDVAPDPNPRQICSVIIKEILNNGILVELQPGMNHIFIQNGDLHVRKIENAKNLGLKVEDKLKVQYLGRHPGSGRIMLSRKTILAPGSALISRKDIS